jgi:F0F1-type ATP synthase membrane subunit b/b'
MQPPDLSLIVVMGIFWATYWVLRITVFKPLGHILEEREATQEAAAAALQKGLDRQKDVLADIDRRLTDARRAAMAQREALRATGATRRQAMLDAAREKAQGLVVEAQGRLETDISTSRAELKGNATAIAADIASDALGRRIA